MPHTSRPGASNVEVTVPGAVNAPMDCSSDYDVWS